MKYCFFYIVTLCSITASAQNTAKQKITQTINAEGFGAAGGAYISFNYVPGL